MQQFMVIERFRAGNSQAVYDRFRVQGRMLPAGLYFVESWLCADDDSVFQVMETGDPALFDEWTQHWADLVDFEIVPLKDKPA